MKKLLVRRGVGARSLLVFIVFCTGPASALAQSATRDLSDFGASITTFTVSISIDVPPGTFAVGLEEAPPTGSAVSAISDGGTWDEGTLEVKWVFIAEPFPTVVTYDVTMPVGAVGNLCFDGDVSFDGPGQSIGGDACLIVGIPTVSGVGLAVMGGLMAWAGAVVVRRRVRQLERCG